MNIPLFLSIFFVLSLIYLAIGIFVSRKIENNDDYFLAGRTLGFFPLTFTLIATHIGGGAILGTAQEAYNHGFAGILYNLGFALGFMILGLGFASKLRGFNVSTIAELFEKKYDSPALKKLASALSAISLGGILAGIVVATRATLIGIGVDSSWILILFWIFVIVYTMIGGLKAVVATDVFQVIIIISVFVGVFIYSLVSDPVSLATLNSLNAGLPKDLSSSRLMSIFLLPIFFSLIEQDFAQRFFAAKNRTVATLGALASSVFLILFSFIPVFFGMKARLLGVESFGASPLVMFLEHTVNETTMAFILCAIFAAITSTADSLLCAISSNLSQDFDFKVKNKVALSQFITLATGIAAFIVAYFFDNIIDVMSHSYDLLISCLWVSVFVCFFTDNLKRSAALYSVLFGLVGFVGFRLLPDLGIPVVIPSLCVSFIGYAVGFYMYRQTGLE